jgi:hypothetical protein
MFSLVADMCFFSSYLEAHEMIRNITGYGEGNGAYISIFEGFIGVDKWYQFGQSATSGLDRVNMDIHQYTVSRYRSPSPSGLALTLPL